MKEWDEITARIEEARSASDDRGVAVFDADGTLWGEDLGERHLKVMEARGVLSASPPYGSVYEEYLQRCEMDTDEGYAWALTAMTGVPEQTVTDAAILAWGAHRELVPEGIHALFRWLESREIEIWIVSASNRWAIEVAGLELGVRPDRIIAMSMDVHEGRLAGQVHRPLCNGEGKADLIRSRIGVRPLLAMGNSRHDIAMLEVAAVGVVVRVAGSEGAVPDRCPVLAAHASNRGWLERTLV